MSNPGISQVLKDNGKNTNSDNDKSEQRSSPVKSTGLKGNCKNTDSDEDKSDQGTNPGKSQGLQGNWKNAKYINESRLYCLIFGSDMAEAKSLNIGSLARSSRKFAKQVLTTRDGRKLNVWQKGGRTNYIIES